MKLEELIDQISEETNIAFSPAARKDLESLAQLKVPQNIIDFYKWLEPKDCVEIDEVRLWPIQDIVRENKDYVPGSDLLTYGFVVIANTIYGDAYCLDCTETNESNDV